MFKRILKSIRANTLVGVFLAVPVVITVLIFNFLFRMATNWLPAGAFPNLRTIWHGYPLRLLTLLAIIVFFYLIGLLIRNILGRRLYQIGDKLLTRIPLIRTIYVSVRQVSESLFTQRKTLFKEVVLVEYPRKGLFSLAFITAVAPPTIAGHINATYATEECIGLFIPTTPNPTSGVFILARRSEIIPIQLSVTDALTFIMSAGAVAPGQQGDHRPALLDKLEAWLTHADEQSSSETASA